MNFLQHPSNHLLILNSLISKIKITNSFIKTINTLVSMKKQKRFINKRACPTKIIKVSTLSIMIEKSLLNPK